MRVNFACVLRSSPGGRYGISIQHRRIDVHKKMLAVVIANARDAELRFECRRFGTTASESRHFSAWLQEHAVQEAAMESTAQYWRPVWVALEGQCRLHLAQARSNEIY